MTHPHDPGLTPMRFLNTSVADARSSLELILADNPFRAAQEALALLSVLRAREGQASRRQMATTILRKAATELGKET